MRHMPVNISTRLTFIRRHLRYELSFYQLQVNKSSGRTKITMQSLHFIWISKLAERNDCTSGSLEIRLKHAYNTVCSSFNSSNYIVNITGGHLNSFLIRKLKFPRNFQKSVQDLRYNCKSCEKESRWPLYLRNILN